MCFFFFKQKTAYEMRISDWSSDVCSSDLHEAGEGHQLEFQDGDEDLHRENEEGEHDDHPGDQQDHDLHEIGEQADGPEQVRRRSEEHTSELQSIMRISHAGCRLKTKNLNMTTTNNQRTYTTNTSRD